MTLKLNFNLLQYFNMLGSFLCIKTRCCFNFCYYIRGVSYYWLFSLFISFPNLGGLGLKIDMALRLHVILSLVILFFYIVISALASICVNILLFNSEFFYCGHRYLAIVNFFNTH